MKGYDVVFVKKEGKGFFKRGGMTATKKFKTLKKAKKFYFGLPKSKRILVSSKY